MDTFAELLTKYIRQAGISDAELARAAGLSRQTIFRWKEGLTGRPNNREDILLISKKLRLSPSENDSLLLAAGFRPEQTAPPIVEDDDIILKKGEQTTAGEPVTTADTPAREAEQHPTQEISSPSLYSRLKTHRLTLIISAAVILIVAGLWLILEFAVTGESSTKEPGGNFTTANQSSITTSTPGTLLPASTGETLIIVATFGDTAAGQTFSDKIVNNLRREINGNRIADYRVEPFQEPVIKQEETQQLIGENNAALIIYGTCNDDEIAIHFQPGLDQIKSPVIIDNDGSLTGKIETTCLIVLAKLSMEEGNKQQAFYFLTKAQNTMYDSSWKDDNIKSIIDGFLLQLE